jgi:hypothetical protein
MLDFIDKSLAKDIDVENEIAFFMPETEGRADLVNTINCRG